MANNNPFDFIWPILIIVAIFFIGRAVLLWYWKINRTIELLEKIEQNTRAK